MRINIKAKDCKFIVNKEKRKVVCIIPKTKYKFLNFLTYNEKHIVLDFCYNEYTLPNQIVGIATCSLDDEWDEELGRRIAFQRAKYKFNCAFFKRANLLMNDIDKFMVQLENKFNKYGEKITENLKKNEDIIDMIEKRGKFSS